MTWQLVCLTDVVHRSCLPERDSACGACCAAYEVCQEIFEDIGQVVSFIDRHEELLPTNKHVTCHASGTHDCVQRAYTHAHAKECFCTSLKEQYK